MYYSTQPSMVQQLISNSEYGCSIRPHFQGLELHRRRGLQNKSILNEKQREWMICNPKSILNTVLVL